MLGLLLGKKVVNDIKILLSILYFSYWKVNKYIQDLFTFCAKNTVINPDMFGQNNNYQLTTFQG